MSQLNIQILHQNYVLTCPDGQESQLLEAVERVDQQFQSIRDSSKLSSRERVGVVLSVNLAYENLELRNQLQALQKKLAHAQGPAWGDADVERLQVLEQQAVDNQAAADALMARLDQVLADAADIAAQTSVDTHEPARAVLATIEEQTVSIENAQESASDADADAEAEAEAFDTSISEDATAQPQICADKDF